MKRILNAIALVTALVFMPLTAQAQITVPNTLQAGAVIRAAELNTNFTAIADKALNRITGGSIEGNITLTDNVTFDGIDISDFLLSTGEVRGGTLGTVSSPTFSTTGDSNTGMYFPALDQIGLSLGGTQRLLLNSSGLTIFGVNIINSSGQIPAISSTYFTSLDGSALTALNASNISSGTLGDARLSSNVPLKDAASNAFTGNMTVGGTLGVTGTTTVGTINATTLTTTNFQLGTSTTSGFVLTADASGVGTWQSPGVATGAVPSGAIMMFDAACPSTYTRVTAWDNKFVRGGATYSATGGGSDTHTHTVDPAAVTSAAGGSHDHGAATGSGGSHSHTTDIGSTATSTDGSHTHDAGTFDTNFTGGHTHSGTTDNGGDHSHGLSGSTVSRETGSFNTSFLTSYSTDSAGTHNHSFTTSSGGDHEHSITGSTGSGGSHSHSVDPASTSSSTDGSHTHSITAAADHTHSVDVASTSTAAGANVPAYVQVVFCKKD
jgi:hypothetical protein